MQLFLFGRTVENGRQSLGILSEITMNARKGRSLENLEVKEPSERKSKRNAFFIAGETIQLYGIKFKILCIYIRAAKNVHSVLFLHLPMRSLVHVVSCFYLYPLRPIRSLHGSIL